MKGPKSCLEKEIPALHKPQIPERRGGKGVKAQKMPQSLPQPQLLVSYQPWGVEWSQSITALVRGDFRGSEQDSRQPLSSLEVSSAFSSPPCPVPAPPCPDMFDKTRSGRIDVYGFSALLRFIQQWRSLFQQYDRDQSGSISFSELQQGG